MDSLRWVVWVRRMGAVALRLGRYGLAVVAGDAVGDDQSAVRAIHIEPFARLCGLGPRGCAGESERWKSWGHPLVERSVSSVR